MNVKLIPMRYLVFVIGILSVLVLGFTNVYGQEEVESSSAGDMKVLGAGFAFGLAALGAGIGLGYVGSAGLAVISENPALQSKVFIFIGMVESIAIYGIVMMFIILGQ